MWGGGGRYFITGKRLYVHNCILAADKPVSYMRAQAIRDGTDPTDGREKVWRH